ncbi:MAG: hypothetical protein LBQ12_04300 [Deltaproteobacteria bacterium]|jgi:S-DNA-T family DNA segregation ATPase FtsK/SpoIIIE|nr:hypothetical protein [Deltaproteobacteria bacterium]
MIKSVLRKAGPDRVRFLMTGPKGVELEMHRDLPRLILPVMIDPADPGDADNALKRAACGKDASCRVAPEKGGQEHPGLKRSRGKGEGRGRPGKGPGRGRAAHKAHAIPGIAKDGLSDLMLASPEVADAAIMRLRAKARVSGIHLTPSTRRPSVDVPACVINANLPTLISFQAATKIDSRTILSGPCRTILSGPCRTILSGPCWTRQVARTSWAKGTCSSSRRAPPGRGASAESAWTTARGAG